MAAIAIDGPAGAGKSTVAKRVSKTLGFIYVDTGAMYRAMALYMLRERVDITDEEAVAAASLRADISIRHEAGEQIVVLNGENVNGLIRTEEVGNTASAVSTVGRVRERLVALQQELARTTDVVMDGRDIGTVVLPQAECKIYLTASSAVRAHRRFLELQAKGETPDEDQIRRDIEERDERDKNREISPLKQADDAVLLDTSDLNIDEAVERILAIYAEKTGRRA
ncbi:MAG: (d)CMP kinase [Lachnospiraceae bacterium]|nr:(d)CMP kinase [Lachnospiraceae bacterium]